MLFLIASWPTFYSSPSYDNQLSAGVTPPQSHHILSTFCHGVFWPCCLGSLWESTQYFYNGQPGSARELASHGQPLTNREWEPGNRCSLFVPEVFNSEAWSTRLLRRSQQDWSSRCTQWWLSQEEHLHWLPLFSVSPFLLHKITSQNNSLHMGPVSGSALPEKSQANITSCIRHILSVILDSLRVTSIGLSH